MVATVDHEGRRTVSGRSLKAIVDFAVGSHPRAVALLLLVALLSFLPGFFSIPPIDRDEARFAQATKQMVESGDYIDIRFQDEVRYKKPVGIYWLQSGVVKVSARAWLRASSHDDLALPGAVAARRHRRCPSDLLGGACLRLAPRRAARRPHDGKLRAPWYRTAHRQDGCHAAPHGRRCDGGDGAGISPGPARATRTGRRLAVGGDILERARRRRAAQGAAHRNDCRAGRQRADRRRSLCPMAAGTQTAGRNRLARAAGPAMVHRDRRTCGRCVLRRVGGTRPAQQGFCRPGVSWRAARDVFRAVLADVLAGRDLGGIGDAGGLDVAPRARGRSSCWRGWCRHGWCWSWCRPSCRIMCCRSIPRSQS